MLSTASTITPHLDHPPSGYSGRMNERTLSSVGISLAVKTACSPRPAGCRDLRHYFQASPSHDQ